MIEGRVFALQDAQEYGRDENLDLRLQMVLETPIPTTTIGIEDHSQALP